MSWIAGIDYSTHAIDVVLVDEDEEKPPVWWNFVLAGQDAFDRARGLPDPWFKSEVPWDDVLAIGLEDPRGHGAGALYRIQGVILANLPRETMVCPWIPSAWRKAVGLKGNATKSDIYIHSDEILPVLWNIWPQDAHDAHLIALATRQAIERQAAA